ncbi:MAG TPA: EAL domain-containing protein [Gaiellaceae bacterium]|nr:EAL domain-containing protein [Gaiellaceae bacterium]
MQTRGRTAERVVRPALVVALAVAVVAGFQQSLFGHLPDALEPGLAPIWVLALVFLGAELYVVHAESRTELIALTPHDAGIVLGLFLVAPSELLFAQLAGAAVALLALRHGRPRLVVTRLASLALGTTVAVLVFTSISRLGDPAGPLGWVAALAAAVTGTVVATLASAAAGDALPARERLRTALALAAAGSVAASSIALAAIALARNGDVAAILLLVPFVSCAVALRAYSSERRRLEHMRALYHSMRSVQRAPGLETGVAELLAETRRLLEAELAMVILLPSDPAAAPLVATATARGEQELHAAYLAPVLDGAVRLVLGSGSLLVLADREPAELRGLLAELATKDALLVRLSGDSGARGVLLVGGSGSVPEFTEDDLRLLETYAGHAGVLIENDRLEQSLTEVTELKEQLRHQAYHDALTGLPNRVLFAERVARAIRPGEEATAAVLFLDLDDFKTINDSLGHHVGDALLVAVARRVEAAVRPGDVPARLGGDEFAVLARVVVTEEAERIADRLVRALEEPFVIEDREISVHTSVGIAFGEPGSALADELLRNADVAMYDAKRGGKRRYTSYEPEMHLRVRERQELGAAIERAVARGEIGVHYQPIVDLSTRRVVALEALARWDRREHGLLAPTSFVPLADELGIMLEIGRTVLRESCRQARAWQVSFPGHEDLTLTVNLAPSELHNPQLATEVATILLETGFAPDRLVLEITESGVMRSPEEALRTMLELRELGVTLALDDFGTGHSSLAHLREFPIDTLKIARPFVAGLPDGELDGVFVDAIVRLATSLGLEVVAEGIESAGQADAVAALGCTHGQGFYFGEPLGELGVSAYLGSRTLPVILSHPLSHVA